MGGKLEIYLKACEGNYFDNVFVEGGPPPIELPDGNFLYFYHGVDIQTIYRIGALVIDKNYKIIARSNLPVFEPQTALEILGWYYHDMPEEIKRFENLDTKRLLEVAQEKRNEKCLDRGGPFENDPIVVFCCGLTLGDSPDGKLVNLYYGAGDSVICGASASLEEILSGSFQ